MSWDTPQTPDGLPLKDAAVKTAPFDIHPAQQEYLLAVLNAPITIHRAFVGLCHKLHVAVLRDLSDLEKESDGTDWIFAPKGGWQKQLGLSPQEQLAARRLLVDGIHRRSPRRFALQAVVPHSVGSDRRSAKRVGGAGNG